MIYLVVGLIGGAICAALAPGKRRSAGGWFCIGFLIPLIGVILILVLQPLPDPNQMAYGYPPQGYPPPPQGYAPPGYSPAGYPPPGYQQPPQGFSPPHDAELHQLDDQRMRGAIGDQEYQAKRAELFARRPS